MFYVYIISNEDLKAFFIGLSQNLSTRIKMHEKLAPIQKLKGHFHLNKLLYVQAFNTIAEAELHEQNIKTLGKDEIEILIKMQNPQLDSLNHFVTSTQNYDIAS